MIIEGMRLPDASVENEATEVKTSLERTWYCYLASDAPTMQVLRTCFCANHHHQRHERQKKVGMAYESTRNQA